MVGVGGRSRGCKTCRRARVKCDENHPVCGRCTRLKLRCEGFNSFPVFIDGLSLLEIQPERENEEKKALSIPISIPQSPNTDLENVYMTHLMRTLFLVPQHDNDSGSLDVVPWVTATIQDNGQNRSSELAVRALAALYYGKLHRHQLAINRGAMLYTQVLCEIRKDLCDPDRVLNTTTLASTVLLAMYEMISFEDMTGWLTHFLGIGQLIRFRGPHRHQGGVGKELFLTARSSIILAYLVRNQRCFLEEHAWKLVPWENDLSSKVTVDYFLDIFCDVPGILEDMRQLQDVLLTAGDCTMTCTILGLRVKSLVKQLYAWRAKWEEDFASTYFSVGMDTLKGLDMVQLDTYPFPSAVFFTEPLRATELCLYNSVLIILYRALKKLPPLVVFPPVFGSHREALNPTTLLAPGQGSVEDFVGEICQIVYYQLKSYSRHTGAIQLIFPLQVAYSSIDPESREAQWLSGIIGYVADVHGFEVVKYSQSSSERTVVV